MEMSSIKDHCKVTEWSKGVDHPHNNKAKLHNMMNGQLDLRQTTSTPRWLELYEDVQNLKPTEELDLKFEKARYKNSNSIRQQHLRLVADVKKELDEI